MKQTSITSRFFGAVVALTVLALAVSAQAMQQGNARVIKLHGAARYSTGNNVWLPISVGTVLRPGSVVQTASESWVDVLLSGEEEVRANPVTVARERTFKPGGDALQNVVRLRENTLLAIDRLTWESTGADSVTDTQLDLRAGTIFGSVKKSSAASRYEVKVPNGVAGIRGTIYSFSATGILTVYVGSIVVTYLNPNNPTETITRVVNAGQQYDMNTDTFSQIPMDRMTEVRSLVTTMTQGAPPPMDIIFTPEPETHISPVLGEDYIYSPPYVPPIYDLRG